MAVLGLDISSEEAAPLRDCRWILIWRRCMLVGARGESMPAKTESLFVVLETEAKS
jgi:hypothetical protein